MLREFCSFISLFGVCKFSNILYIYVIFVAIPLVHKPTQLSGFLFRRTLGLQFDLFKNYHLNIV
jgi:hypothetical protein